MSTSEYQKKRDFRRTTEPRGDSGGKKSGDKPIFVIQKHDASSLHYDFRIEVDGALKSWAVPKGPSPDPSEKRLAVPTEDHPLEYADFEGVIPEGEYGAGTVLVWDRGPFENVTEKDDQRQPLADALDNGHALIDLDGEKIKGVYVLQRTGSGDDARWLLIKMDDEHADARRNPVSAQPESVLSDRTLEQVAAENEQDDGDGQ
ncbi:MAG: DNA polymerase ligase N-terminal domain-containing protein [Wenzhouxiangellaceae bacterium]|nr:DNA polymerase ligase N-terminal domain-containing protein [Wenzhouxiangellaceae bacterium]